MRVSRDKCIRDIVRLEIAALLALSRTGKSVFMQDVLDKTDPSSKAIALDELKAIEDMLRIKVEAVDEA